MPWAPRGVPVAGVRMPGMGVPGMPGMPGMPAGLGIGVPGQGPLNQFVQPQWDPSPKGQPLQQERERPMEKSEPRNKGGKGKQKQPKSEQPRKEKAPASTANPKQNKQWENVEMEPPTDESERTSVMLRNIPNKYTQRMLLSVVHDIGFTQESFDFFYLPIDFRNKCNVGYAFINFLQPDLARRFFKALDGYQLRAFNSDKVCAVAWARVQGLQANVEHYRNSPIAGVPIPQYRPLLFKAGVEIPFPEPDGPLARVRLRVPKGAPTMRKNRNKGQQRANADA